MRFLDRIGFGNRDHVDDAQWLERFMDLYRRATPTVKEVLESDVISRDDHETRVNLGKSAVAGSTLYPFIYRVKKLPKPNDRVLREVKTEFGSALLSCQEACLEGVQLVEKPKKSREERIALSLDSSKRAMARVSKNLGAVSDGSSEGRTEVR